MSSTEADANAASQEETPAPAAAAAAKAVPKAVPRRPPIEEDPLCSGTCVMIFIIIICCIFFGVVGLAYFSVWPVSMVRPFFFDSPYALTKDNWDAKVSGRTTFIKFYAPWCGHCKKIAPHWDKLSAENVDHSFLTVGEVDCTGKGKPLCEELGISGFPTLKYGDPNNLQDYKGGRTYEDLVKFAAGLEPTCSPGHVESCTEEQKKQLEEFKAMNPADREAKIKEQEAEIETLQKNFKAFVEQLNGEYKDATTKKEEGVKEVQDSGLSMLKAVIAHQATEAKSGETAKGEEAKGEEAKSEL